MNNKQLITAVAGSADDFEWYPTTAEIIATIKSDIDEKFHLNPSLLDCGAGDGRVLLALTEGKKFAIEKSKPLLNALDRKIFVVGTDFHQQTLIDKNVDVVFSNPPYSEYERWSQKIILEAKADHIYLVIPDRWARSTIIEDALDMRSAEAEIIGTFDFLKADRAARAVVNVIRISSSNRLRRGESLVSDPFSIWFEQNFKINAKKRERGANNEGVKSSSVKDSANNELVAGGDFTKVLENLYHRDLAKLTDNYKALELVDSELLAELNVSINGLKEALKLKITGLKDVYWKEFFDRIDKITNRLTVTKRKRMLDMLTENTHIDFTTSNAYALTIWVIKNANEYFDDQLVDTFERMIAQANVINYTSNQKTFGAEDWKWHSRPKDLERFALENRVVLQGVGGIWNTTWEWEQKRYGGLTARAADFINDVRTVADNLGFSVEGFNSAEQFNWSSNKKVIFLCKDLRTRQQKTLMEVKAFLNGNLHIKFDQDFMCRLNVEFGRLKGWLKCAKQAASDLDIKESAAMESFATNLCISQDAPQTLLGFEEDYSEAA